MENLFNEIISRYPEQKPVAFNYIQARMDVMNLIRMIGEHEKMKLDGQIIELPVKIGGVGYIPYACEEINGDPWNGVEEVYLTGYIDERLFGGEVHYFYHDGGDAGDVEIDKFFISRAEAETELIKMIDEITQK